MRSLLILTVIVSIPLAWQVNRVRGQRRAVAAIAAAGGFVIYDYEARPAPNSRRRTDGEKYRRPTPNPPPGPQWLRFLAGDDILAEVVEVNLRTYGDLSEGTRKATNDALALLPNLPDVKVIRANGVSDIGLEHIARKPSVLMLDVQGFFTDEGVSKLRYCSHLQVLRLSGRGFSEDASKCLKDALPNSVVSVDRWLE